MDTLTKAKRSWNMSRIQSRHTKPERMVRSILHKEGFRFRLHVRELPGSPDLVLPRYGCVIFVHGCFWHRHKGCRLAYKPKTHTAFWNAKFVANVKRDALVRRQLKQSGWRIIVLWECEIDDAYSLAKRICGAIQRHEVETLVCYQHS